MLKRSKAVVVALLLAAIWMTSSCNRFRKTPTPPEPSPSPSVSSTPTPQPTTTRLPTPAGLVNDYANVIDTESESRLVDLLTKLRAVSNIEFAVVTIDTTKGEPIADYSLAVAREWRVGPNSADGGGLLLLLAIKDRQWHLQVSRSLEKDLPNDVAKKLAEGSTALYKQGNFGAGIEKYVNAIIARLGKQRNFSIK